MYVMVDYNYLLVGKILVFCFKVLGFREVSEEEILVLYYGGGIGCCGGYGGYGGKKGGGCGCLCLYG